MFKKNWYIWLTSGLISVSLIIFSLSCYGVYRMLTDPIKTPSIFYSIEVAPDDIVDYNVFLNPTGKFEKLEAIEETVRVQIAWYMKENNLKLAPGVHDFNRVNGTFESLIKYDFKFAKINNQSP